MATTNQHQQAGLGTAGGEVTRAAAGDGGQPMAARLPTEQVWQQVAKASFAVLGYVTPSGEPRSSGVVYKTRTAAVCGRRTRQLEGKHVAASRRVAVTVPVRRGGLLSLVAPIPPATISFHATAIVHPAGSLRARSLSKDLGSYPGRAAGLRLHHRGRPRGRVRDLRPGRVAVQDA